MSVRHTVRRGLLSALCPSGRRGRLMILTYHQVPAEPDSLQPGSPHGDAFAAQMEWLTRYCTVLPLPEAAERLANGDLPARAAAVTFDDGYANNLEVAAPVLKNLDISATFFVTTGAIERGIMWNDLVIEGIRNAAQNLDLGDMGLGVHQLSDAESRRVAIRSVIAELKYRPLDRRIGIAEEIYARAGGPPMPRLMMTPEQVRQLAELGFDVGAHTVNHPILEQLSPEVAQAEIERSRDWVHEVLGRKPVSFAYPNGRPGTDFTAAHEGMVRAAGFSVAVSTRWACARRRDSAFALPRFTPWERQESGFVQRLMKTALRSYIE